jgi:hypothetical protein
MAKTLLTNSGIAVELTKRKGKTPQLTAALVPNICDRAILCGAGG